MKIKRKFAVYNMAMLITPIVLIGVISILMLLIFIFNVPVDELNISRAQLLSPAVFAEAVGEFLKNNPEAMLIMLLWLLLCLALIAASCIAATRMMTRSIEKPVNDLSAAAELIRGGNLDFEVLGSDYDEINTLCTNFEAMRQALKSAKRREDAMGRERSMLLANISHDLKTPITSIKGYVDGIRDGVADSPEKLERYVNIIYTKAELIDELVNNLSLYSRLEMGRLEFNFCKIDLNEFLHDFIGDLMLDMEEMDIGLEADISPQPAEINADKEKLSRVFTNIIDNAVKYRAEKAPKIEVKTVVDDMGVYVYISDNGIGIDDAELGRVFAEFYRTDSSRSIKGSGLGLGIVRQIIKKHGGKAWLQSEGIGRGTTAIVYLPLAERG